MIQQSSIEELCGIMEDVNKAREEFKSKEMA